MQSPLATVEANNLDKNSFCISCNPSEQRKKVTRLSALNILTAIGTRFFNASSNAGSLSQELAVSTHTAAWSDSEKKVPLRGKLKKEEKPMERRITTSISTLKTNERRKYIPTESGRIRILRNDRDFRRFRTKYNATMGNIMREWMGLIYSILILRMNLIKFILKRLPEEDEVNPNLHKQILFESKTLYDMVRNAQHFSQERFLCLWTELEKLISNRAILKIAMQQIQTKENGFQDWKTAIAKLTELENEYEKYHELYNDLQKNKTMVEHLMKEKMAKLENLVDSRDTAYDMLVEQITEMKKKEVQMRGKILLNLKSYKDLKAKKQNLLNIEKEMNKLTTQQNSLVIEYSSKIQTLKNEIEEKEKLIKLEKEEKKKIKATLEGFGDFTEVHLALHD